MIRKIRNMLFGFFIILLGCSEKRVHLIDNFYSYQTHDELRSLIDSAITASGKEDELSDIVIRYNHIGEEGKLGLRFFDDQLVAVGFYPSDTLSYVEKLESELGVSFASSPTMIKNGVAIFKGYDYEIGSIGGMFVSWSDLELVKKYEGKVW